MGRGWFVVRQKLRVMQLVGAGIGIAALAATAVGAQSNPQEKNAPAPMVVPMNPPIPAAGEPRLPCGPTSRAAQSCASPARPKGNPGLWITNDDYPTRAMREHREGKVSFRLYINKDGSVSGCEIVASSGFDSLDAPTCEILMSRASFYPARDEYGEPAVGTWTSRINWSVPVE